MLNCPDIVSRAYRPTNLDGRAKGLEMHRCLQYKGEDNEMLNKTINNYNTGIIDHCWSGRQPAFRLATLTRCKPQNRSCSPCSGIVVLENKIVKAILPQTGS
jgi:hypothetical protein